MILTHKRVVYISFICSEEMAKNQSYDPACPISCIFLIPQYEEIASKICQKFKESNPGCLNTENKCLC